MVARVFRLGDKQVSALMTPRSQIVWHDLRDSPEGIWRKLRKSGYSRFPVGQGSLDNVVGVVQAKDLLIRSLSGQPVDLEVSLRQPLFVPESMPALNVLELFKQSDMHIALVIDEHGGLKGLLTHHDILEAIAGDIPSAAEPAKPQAQQREDGSWLLDGMLSVDEFKEIFHLESLPGENRDAYQTLGGFVFTQMGRIPAASDQFEWNGLRFEIVDMDGKRIDKVVVGELRHDLTPFPTARMSPTPGRVLSQVVWGQGAKTSIICSSILSDSHRCEIHRTFCVARYQKRRNTSYVLAEKHADWHRTSKFSLVGPK